jgi:hypothetical protein
MRWRMSAICLMAMGLLPAQTQPAEPGLELASVKRSLATNGSARGGPGSEDPVTYRATGVTLRGLLGRAAGFRKGAN